MWSEKSGDGDQRGGQKERGREKWSECCAWSTRAHVCVCMRLKGRRGERLNTNATYETRNGEVLQCDPSRSLAQLWHGCKNRPPPPGCSPKEIP